MTERAYSWGGYAAGILIASVVVCVAILAAWGPDDTSVDQVKVRQVPTKVPRPILVGER
jgi:hypothetical protein